MIKTIKTFLVAISAALIVYLLGCLIMWDMNPGQWEQGNRTLLALVSTIAAIVAALINHYESK